MSSTRTRFVTTHGPTRARRLVRWSSRRCLALSASLLIGSGLLAAPLDAAASADPSVRPTCADVPFAQTDPGATKQANWAIPPGGNCYEAVGTRGGSALVLSYPDGRIWARWLYAPVDQGRVFYFSDGTRLEVVGRPGVGEALSIAAPNGQRLALPPVDDARRAGRACGPSTPSVRLREGGRLILRPGTRPSRAWAKHLRGSVRVLRAAPVIGWTRPAELTTGTVVVFGLNSGIGNRRYEICVRPSRTSPP